MAAYMYGNLINFFRGELFQLILCFVALAWCYPITLICSRTWEKNASRLKRRDERVLEDDTIVQCVHKIRQCAHLLEAAVTALLAAVQSMKIPGDFKLIRN